jgi:hypothetical protein
MMNKKLSILPIALMVLGFSSCLKEGRDNITPSLGVPNVVEFANSGANLSNVAKSTYPRFGVDLGQLGVGASKDFEINVNYSGVEFAPEDITVNLEIDESILTKFNTENDTHYTLPTADIYSFPSTVVIKKGEKRATVSASIKLTNSYDFSKSYGLPLRIKSASIGKVSGNFGAAVYSFSVRNQYDGVYTIISGNVQRYTEPGVPTVGDALNGSLAGNPNLTLTTVNGTTVEISNMTWHGGASGIAGIDNTQIVVDPTTNLVTMKALGNATMKNWPGKENKYDPATQTFTLNFHWNPTANVRELSYVIKYLRPR